MRFRSGRAVASGVGVALMVTSVAVGAAPPGISGRQARQARAQVSDPTRLTIPRNGQARPVAASTRRARARLRASLGRGAQVTVDEQTGGLKAVGRLDGFLTGASGGGARAVALGYVRAHADAFGLTASDLGALRLVRDYRSVDGVRHLQWAQVVDGITVVDSSLLANVTRDGRLINVAGGARGGLRLTTRSPHIGADGAYTRALRSVGSRRPAPARRSARSTGSRRTTYAGRGQAELVAYHAGAGLRLAWRVLAPVGHDGDYDTLVDAATGRIARRSNLVRFADALVFDNTPGDHPGGTQTRRPIGPWLESGATRLRGDNAWAFRDVRDEVGTRLTEDEFIDTFDPPEDGDVPPSNGVDWLYPVTSVADPAGFCPPDPPGCTWNHTTPNSWQVNDEQATTQLFYFVNKFHDHLLAPPIGFDEASGNFEQVNQSGQGKGGDPVWAQSDDGAATDNGLPDGGHQDNANFDPRPDGIPGRMQMYLWQPLEVAPGFVLPFATVNGTDDPSIVYHEYTHGLSNRLITDSQGFGATYGTQSGAMGEAWSDWYALDFLARQGLIGDAPAAGDVKEGAYVDNGSNLIRSEPIDCPPDQGSDACPGFAETGPGGYTYEDFGLIAAGAPGGAKLPEVHADGEIWAQTLWQLRQRLVARYGEAGGSDRAERYITGGMRLGPPQPSFLDQRNAILQASTVAGGADSDILWDVFASRGMGYFASTRGDYDANPDADFATPPTGGSTGIVRGIVRDDGGAPVAGALVGLGGHDGPPGAGPALQSTTGADGAYEITGIPQASYPQLTVEAPAGYADALGGAVTVGSAAVSRDLTVRRNYADARAGATITSDARDDRAWGCGWPNLIDGDEATVLETASPDDPGTEAVESTPRSFTVTLPQAVDGAEVLVDPSSGCGVLADSSLSGYTVQVSTDGSSFTTVGAGTFDRHSLYRLNRVPTRAVPDGVRAVRLIAHSTQAALGGPVGDLGVLDIAELQVYARPSGPSAPGTPGTPGTPGAPGTPVAPGTAQLRPDLSRARRKVRVSRKRMGFRVRCVRATPGVAPRTCRLRLSIDGVLSGRPLARRTVVLKPGSYRTVRLPTRARDRRRLRRGSVKTRLRARVANAGGPTRTASRALRILRIRSR